MCWELILVGLVPVLMLSATASASVLLATGNIPLHRTWMIISAILFIGTCYQFSANDNHTGREDTRKMWDVMIDLATMPDTGLGSSLELGAFLATLVGLGHTRMTSRSIAMGTIAAVLLYALLIRHKTLRAIRDHPPTTQKQSPNDFSFPAGSFDNLPPASTSGSASASASSVSFTAAPFAS